MQFRSKIIYAHVSDVENETREKTLEKHLLLLLGAYYSNKHTVSGVFFQYGVEMFLKVRRENSEKII